MEIVKKIYKILRAKKIFSDPEKKELLIYDENEGIYKVNVYKKNKRGFNLEFPLINFNETLKIFVDHVGNTLLKGNFNNFNYNFSLNLTKTILKITKND